MKRITFSAHALSYLERRGFSEEEVRETIKNSTWVPARGGRFEASADFPFDSEWNGKYYETKQVRPVFVEEGEAIVVITVYTYYF